MALADAFVFEALIRHNYLPAQRKKKEELPPIFSSSSLTPAVGELLCAENARKVDGFPGYDQVEYCATRFNNVPRVYGIPHPLGYAKLAKCIADNWDKLNYTAKPGISKIRPKEFADGRVIIMDYDAFPNRAKASIRLGFAKRYKVSVDVSNCFHSIYTHAISWATVGFNVSKAAAKKGGATEWFNLLDKAQRRIKRDETQGIAIGPGSSNILSEAILARIDETLIKEFTSDGKIALERHIDDYTFYCVTEDEALRFIRRVNEELGRYKLTLNTKKTQIQAQVLPLNDDWAVHAASMLPKPQHLSVASITNYLDFIFMLAVKHPNSSVLKYGATAITRVLSKAKFGLQVCALDYLLALAVHHPVLLPILEVLITRIHGMGIGVPFSDRILKILQENAEQHRPDGMTWTLHMCRKFGIDVPDELAKKIVSTKDCVALVTLNLFAQHRHLCKAFVKTDLDHDDLYELDRYWLLLYEMHRQGQIVNPYAGDNTFSILKNSGVFFVN